MGLVIFETSIDALETIVEEGARASKQTTKRFIEPAQGTLRRATSRRHHIIFGRRGSGKSSLLYKSATDLDETKQAIAYVDLEPFKGHQYPDVLISVLLAVLTKYRAWLTIEDTSEKSWLKKVLSLIHLQWATKDDSKRNLLELIEINTRELSTHLHLADDSRLVGKFSDTKGKRDEVSIGGKASVKSQLLESSLESNIASAVESSASAEIQEESRRSKKDYLHRKIIDFRQIFQNFTELTGGDCFLFLDDLYHIHRTDQAYLLDYFHRIAKGSNLWIKVGTIKNRSTWYIHSPQPIGLKLGDDADEINLDLTLEKFSVSKDFLKAILETYINESQAPSLNDFVADGGMERLVMASGGVTRDFLGIFRRSIDETRERLTRNRNHPRGPKIGAEDVNVASGGYGETKKEEFQRDTLEDRQELEEAFNKLRMFCLDKSKTNIFLVDQDLKGSDNELLQELIDLRLIHHVKSRVTVSSRPGKVFRALLLDVSQYTGERKRRDVDMIEFWKEANKEAIRKASLIYDPSQSTDQLEKEVVSKKSAMVDEKAKPVDPKQQKLI